MATIGKVIGVAGCTNAGKTTMARMIAELVSESVSRLIERSSLTVTTIAQDDFFKEMDSVRRIWKEGDPSVLFYDYDSAQAVDERGLLAAIDDATTRFDYVIVEGNLLTELPRVDSRLERTLFVTLDKNTCRCRRSTRSYMPPDQPGYFDQVVWPFYLGHLQRVQQRVLPDNDVQREQSSIIFVDGCNDLSSIRLQLVNIVAGLSQDFIQLQSAAIFVQEFVDFVTSPSNGAISVFIGQSFCEIALGTTRDTFQGKKVLNLEYEAYTDMAYKELRKLCARLRQLHPAVTRIAIVHRTGLVPVGETSVLIACSSPHRRDALAATEWAIDELKRTVPIWKKEIYEDGSCSWKENIECTGRDHNTTNDGTS